MKTFPNSSGGAINKDRLSLVEAGGARILIADDDSWTSESVSSLNDHYRIVVVRDGREAYRLLKTDADFAVAVLSLNLPCLRGVDIINYMKTERRLMRIPVVIISGEMGIDTISSSFSAGAMAFIPKPFTTDQLEHILRLTLNSKQSRPQLHRAA